MASPDTIQVVDTIGQMVLVAQIPTENIGVLHVDGAVPFSEERTRA